MKLSEFRQLNYNDKIAVANNAVCIGNRSDPQHRFLLYQLNNFYIEVRYHKRYNYITDVDGFDNMDLLEPYLQSMDLSFAV